jgi:myo-inositol-1(or 4)-monophosphatase
MKLTSANINVMVKACRKASKILIRDFGEIEKLQVSVKGPGDFVTKTDIKVEQILVEELNKARPSYSIIAEELGSVTTDRDENFKWIIDPIDGTSNFLHGIPHFAISVGLEHNKEIICGIIYDPIKDEMFFAEKGNGSYLNNQRIRVSSRSKLNNCMVVTGGPRRDSSEREKVIEEYKKFSSAVDIPIRKMGSAALDMAYVAAGRFDGFWQRNLNYWDIAAGIIIVKEAGGFVTDFSGNNKYVENKTILVANSKINEEMITILNN